MKTIAINLIVIACISSGIALAEGKYDRKNVCPQGTSTSDCDHLVENAVSKEIPGVIERLGSVLRIHSKNGKVVELKNSGAEVTNEPDQWELWACNYFPKTGCLQICYRYWESSKTGFININSGNFVSINGWPIFSPSGNKVLMIDGYGGDIYSLEIWRFEKGEFFKELNLASPSGSGENWGDAIWKNENEIVPKLPSNTPHLRYRLAKEGADWRLK